MCFAFRVARVLNALSELEMWICLRINRGFRKTKFCRKQLFSLTQVHSLTLTAIYLLRKNKRFYQFFILKSSIIITIIKKKFIQIK